MDLRIRIYPDPVLREQSKSVSFPRIGEFDERLSKTVTYMREFMQSLDGVGLAAPQIGILERIIVIDIDNDPIYLINPEIIEKEGECLFEEGCLSVPGTSINIKRPFCVVVKGYDIEGKERHIEAKKLLARVFQHEIDHLNGKLIIDFLKKEELLRFHMDYNPDLPAFEVKER